MNEKILVVDDEKEIADLLEVYLKNDNYIVHKYYNGIEALECIQKTEIDLAILDVMLPDVFGGVSTWMPHSMAVTRQHDRNFILHTILQDLLVIRPCISTIPIRCE